MQTSSEATMTTLIRSGSAATKIVCGVQPAKFVVVPILTPTASVVPIQDCPSEVKTAASFRALAKRVSQLSPFSSSLASKGVTVTTRRFAHTDIAFPNFDEYRRKETLDPTKPARDSESKRRAVNHLVCYGVGGALALIASKEFIQESVIYKSMPSDQIALGTTEINLDEISEGQTRTYEWRGKPIFVKHRTANEIKRERAVQVSQLRHPEKDEDRVQKDEWLVVIAVCSHLGCVPVANAGDFMGGYYCPCHGTHFDGSGRIRKGPAPLNLEVPPHRFEGNTVIIGSSE